MSFSRRDFLRASAFGVGTTAAVGPALEALAQETASAEVMTRAKQELRWGIVGTGSRALKAHIRTLQAIPEMQIVAVCDVDEKRLKQGVQRAGNKVEAYRDYQELLARADIDAVAVCTPNIVHREVVVAALEASKHVLCEKPIATTMDECAAIGGAQDAHPNQVLLFTLQLRYSPRYHALRKLVEEGRIGKPKYIFFAEFRGDWNRGDVWQYRDPATGEKMNWRFSHAATGGTLNEKVCHYFDILNWVAGECRSD